MSELPLRPRNGGYCRPVGCGTFIRQYLSGNGPFGSPVIVPSQGAPQADIFYHYKSAIIRVTAEEHAVIREEKIARSENRAIIPERIESLTKYFLLHIPYKTTACRYHSFVVYFSTLRKLAWVEPSGHREPSAFQDNYPQGNPRIYYRLTSDGLSAPEAAWSNPHFALYGS